MATAKKAETKAAAKKTDTKAASKSTTKKAASKKETGEKSGRKPNAAFMAELKPSENLAAVIGDKPLPRTEIIKKIWDYIKEHKLQDEKNKRMINADAKLKKLFGADQVSMFDLAKIVSQNVSK